jgi:hypothetical protein
MCLLHVSVIVVPQTDPRTTTKSNERQVKVRHLLCLVIVIDVVPRRNQLLHRVRFTVTHRDEDRGISILGPHSGSPV